MPEHAPSRKARRVGSTSRRANTIGEAGDGEAPEDQRERQCAEPGAGPLGRVRDDQERRQSHRSDQDGDHVAPWRQGARDRSPHRYGEHDAADHEGLHERDRPGVQRQRVEHQRQRAEHLAHQPDGPAHQVTEQVPGSDDARGGRLRGLVLHRGGDRGRRRAEEREGHGQHGHGPQPRSRSGRDTALVGSRDEFSVGWLRGTAAGCGVPRVRFHHPGAQPPPPRAGQPVAPQLREPRRCRGRGAPWPVLRTSGVRRLRGCACRPRRGRRRGRRTAAVAPRADPRCTRGGQARARREAGVPPGVGLPRGHPRPGRCRQDGDRRGERPLQAARSDPATAAGRRGGRRHADGQLHLGGRQAQGRRRLAQRPRPRRG